jgi:hypothetical protein
VIARPQRRAILALLLLAGCGYRPAGPALPGGARSVRVVLADPSATDEPALAPLLAEALCRELGRAGIVASTLGPADTVLQTRIISLDGVRPVPGPARRIAATDLALRLEAVLRVDGRAAWRSGLVEVEAVWPIVGADPARSEASRRTALERLSSEAARRVVRGLALR